MQIWHMKRAISGASLTATSVMFGKARMVGMSSIARWVGPKRRVAEASAVRRPARAGLQLAAERQGGGDRRDAGNAALCHLAANFAPTEAAVC
jgi:hypothetical protein